MTIIQNLFSFKNPRVSNTSNIGEEVFTTPGTYNWTVPSGVYEISAVCVGGGGGGGGTTNLFSDLTRGGGGGGALSYSNFIPVTPGETLSITVGLGGNGGNSSFGEDGGSSFITRSDTILVSAEGGFGGGFFNASGGRASAGVGDTCFNGGTGGFSTRFGYGGGGGGAAGYSGNGGSGGQYLRPNGSSGTGGGGGGGFSGDTITNSGTGGGGVNLYGKVLIRPQVTTIPNILLGNQNLTLLSISDLTAGIKDSGYWYIPLPWIIKYNTRSYSDVYVHTNSYITFGEGNATNVVSLTTPRLDRILIQASAFNSGLFILHGIEGSSPNRTYRIRFVGNNTSTGTTQNMIWEMTFFEDDITKIVVQNGTLSRSNGLSGFFNELGSIAAGLSAQFTGYQARTFKGLNFNSVNGVGSNTSTNGGGGGSTGKSGSGNISGITGGRPGGIFGGGGGSANDRYTNGGNGADGGVRIIWGYRFTREYDIRNTTYLTETDIPQ
jgi:hypothetical protein